jgi:hypothetical protein
MVNIYAWSPSGDFVRIPNVPFGDAESVMRGLDNTGHRKVRMVPA